MHTVVKGNVIVDESTSGASWVLLVVFTDGRTAIEAGRSTEGGRPRVQSTFVSSGRAFHAARIACPRKYNCVEESLARKRRPRSVDCSLNRFLFARIRFSPIANAICYKTY
jgi:hypothetical protein